MAKEKIVVIDDSPIVRKLAELALEEEGYKVYSAEDGEEGLRMSEEVIPSVILVDFIMPRMSGYQFCKAARENELLKDIPIILITGKGEDVGKKFAEKFGVVDYFIKPFKSEMLIDKVNSIINAQRLAGGETQLFETFGGPDAEVQSYSLEETEPAAGPAYELPEVPAVPGEPAYAVDALDVPDAADIVKKDTLETPLLSFDEVATMEEPQRASEGVTEEIDPGTSSFDFNLDALTTLQAEAEVDEMPAMPAMSETAAEIPEVFDFETIKELEGMATLEDMDRTGPQPVAGSLAHFTDTAATEETMDRIMQRYFSSELPLLIEKSVEGVLKRHNIIKPTAILFSGSLQEISSVEVLKLIASSRLTGKFSAFSAAGSAEVYFDGGLVAYALTSRHGRPPVMKQGTFEVSGESLSKRMSETLTMVADLQEGGFFFEKMDVPVTLLDIPQRINIVALLLEGERSRQGGEGELHISDDIIFAKQAGDILDCGLNDEEQRIFTIADGIRPVGDIVSLSGLGPIETRKIFYRLAKAGVLSHKGGF